MMIFDCPEVKVVADRQFGLIAHRQVTELGFTATAIRATVHTGRWRPVLPTVYLTEPGHLDVEQQRTAAGLYTAGLGHLTGLPALAWHGIADLPTHDTLVMLVPHHIRRISYDFVQVQRTRRFDPTAQQAGQYHVCGVARATADACRRYTDVEAASRLIRLVISTHDTTVDALRAELAAAGSSRTRPLRLALTQFTDQPGDTTSRPDSSTIHADRPAHAGCQRARRRMMRSATSAVQPVWWEAPSPTPVSPWKYS